MQFNADVLCITTGAHDHGQVFLVETWWRHQMEKFFRVTGHLCGVPGEFPAQRPVTQSFDVFFHLRLNQRLSKQSWGWWFQTLPRPLWRHCNKEIYTWCGVCTVWLCLGIFWWFYPYPSGLLHWHWGNLMIAPVPVKQPWNIWEKQPHESTDKWVYNQSEGFHRDPVGS